MAVHSREEEHTVAVLSALLMKLNTCFNPDYLFNSTLYMPAFK